MTIQSREQHAASVCLLLVHGHNQTTQLAYIIGISLPVKKMLEQIKEISAYVVPTLGILKGLQILPDMLRRFAHWRKNHEKNKENRLRGQLRQLKLYSEDSLALNAATKHDQHMALGLWSCSVFLFFIIVSPGYIKEYIFNILIIEMVIVFLFGIISWREASKRLIRCKTPAKTKIDIELEIQITRLKTLQKKVRETQEAIYEKDIASQQIHIPSLKSWNIEKKF